MDQHTLGNGLQYKRNRFYDPGTGRFTQEDPIGLAGGLNSYGYANGDPINLSDPLGLCPIEVDGIPCAVTYGTAGAGIGLGTGIILSGLTTTGTGGLATPAIPFEVSASTAVGATVGTAVGTVVDHKDQVVANVRSTLKNWRSILVGLYQTAAVAMSNQTPDPKKHDDCPDPGDPIEQVGTGTSPAAHGGTIDTAKTQNSTNKKCK